MEYLQFATNFGQQIIKDRPFICYGCYRLNLAFWQSLKCKNENELVENETVLCTELAYCPSSTIRLHLTIYFKSILSFRNRIYRVNSISASGVKITTVTYKNMIFI